jgi:hypothetical protein
MKPEPSLPSSHPTMLRPPISASSSPSIASTIASQQDLAPHLLQRVEAERLRRAANRKRAKERKASIAQQRWQLQHQHGIGGIAPIIAAAAAGNILGNGSDGIGGYGGYGAAPNGIYGASPYGYGYPHGGGFPSVSLPGGLLPHALRTFSQALNEASMGAPPSHRNHPDAASYIKDFAQLVDEDEVSAMNMLYAPLDGIYDPAAMHLHQRYDPVSEKQRVAAVKGIFESLSADVKVSNTIFL